MTTTRLEFQKTTYVIGEDYPTRMVGQLLTNVYAAYWSPKQPKKSLLPTIEALEDILKDRGYTERGNCKKCYLPNLVNKDSFCATCK